MSNEPSIEQMNLIIARFIGMEGTDEFIRQNYQYHNHWQLLMPVVEKIEKDYNAEMEISHCCCYVGVYPEGFDKSKCIVSITYPEAKTKIEAVHKAVYQFIQWLNQQKKQLKPCH